MTQERINEILAIVDRAKEYDGINYALERAINELIREVQALAEKRSKGCDLCMPVNTMKSMGAYGRKFMYCPMCGKRLEVEP
jgi:hypothetical protein